MSSLSREKRRRSSGKQVRMENCLHRYCARLQRFSVQVHRHELERMKKEGRIDTKNGFLHVLVGGTGYSEKTGLDVTLEHGVPVEDLMF